MSDFTRNDAWEWRAIYSDGTFLDEYPGDEQRGWRDIDLDRMTHLVLVPQRDGLQHHVLALRKGARPIFFRRRSIELNPDSGEESGRRTVHALGMQWTVRGENVQSLMFLFEDGSVVLSDDSDAV